MIEKTNLYRISAYKGVSPPFLKELRGDYLTNNTLLLSKKLLSIFYRGKGKNQNHCLIVWKQHTSRAVTYAMYRILWECPWHYQDTFSHITKMCVCLCEQDNSCSLWLGSKGTLNTFQGPVLHFIILDDSENQSLPKSMFS